MTRIDYFLEGKMKMKMKNEKNNGRELAGSGSEY